MKVFKENICFVDPMDLTRYGVPSFLKLDDIVFCQEEYIKINDKESIEYIKNREDIINYNEISKYTDEELEEHIKKAYAELEPLAKQWTYATTKQRVTLNKNENYINTYRIKEYIYYGLLEYKENREEIDKSIENHIKKLLKK